ncbi:TRIHELIX TRANSCRIPTION FACTOR ASIL2 [Salix purpurea]|uniref:TRIHELIX TRANSCRIPTION FACTOR ASIL2 n=1 Tax=Salix purpurea TaxID=77065 RepID=A0A9Q0QDU2_SALPP|nr:TRIHELIX TRANSCRIPTION FACTOR ASIL2 [Salix purpurea]
MDDDEIQSPSNTTEHSSPSPSPPTPTGRIAVSAPAASSPALPPPSPPQQNNCLALVLPTQSKANGGGGGGREDCWSEGATAVLIDAWGERYLELSRGNLKQKHWKEVAEILKVDSGGGPSGWPFFDPLDKLIGSTARITVVGNGYVGSKIPTREEDEEEEEDGAESDDSFPPMKKRKVVVERGVGKEKRGGWGNSIRMLTQAMVKFGEAYEQAESAKLQQVVEMEKTRMEFVKELELQRMQFFMQTQMEISQLKKARKGGNASSNHYHHEYHRHHTGNNINASNTVNNSDSDG